MIAASGISELDPRIAHTMAKVKESGKQGEEHLTLDEFAALIRPDLRMMCVCGRAIVNAPTLYTPAMLLCSNIFFWPTASCRYTPAEADT